MGSCSSKQPLTPLPQPTTTSRQPGKGTDPDRWGHIDRLYVPNLHPIRPATPTPSSQRPALPSRAPTTITVTRAPTPPSRTSTPASGISTSASGASTRTSSTSAPPSRASTPESRNSTAPKRGPTNLHARRQKDNETLQAAASLPGFTFYDDKEEEEEEAGSKPQATFKPKKEMKSRKLADSNEKQGMGNKKGVVAMGQVPERKPAMVAAAA